MAPSPPPLNFPNLDSLTAFLRPRLPPSALDSWGAVPGTKTLLNLFLELSHGDSTLLTPAPSQPTQPPVVRAVQVATVRIRNRRGARLVESRQLLSDGSVRCRRRPLSEKMRPGESAHEAAVRAVREELGRHVGVSIVGGEREVKVEERESASYPGLPARYVMHAVEAEVDGVPEEGEFETEETGEEDGEDGVVTVKRHFWAWVDEYDGDGDATGDGDQRAP